LGCNSPEAQKCKAEYDSSQKVVLGIDGSSIDSVSESLRAVDSALEACKAAQRNGEVDNLVKARAQIQAQHDALVKRAGRAKRVPLTPDELARFEKNGDPSCPKGQGYEHAETKKLIKCSGPQLADMSWSGASKYFEKRGYKLSSTDTQLSAEYGAEKFTFTFRKKDDAGPPVCLAIVASPGIPWLEVTTRATGVHPDKLKRDEPVKMNGRSVNLSVGGDATQAVVHLGTCPPASGAATPG
jgi:hypothetical protein